MTAQDVRHAIWQRYVYKIAQLPGELPAYFIHDLCRQMNVSHLLDLLGLLSGRNGEGYGRYRCRKHIMKYLESRREPEARPSEPGRQERSIVSPVLNQVHLPEKLNAGKLPDDQQTQNSSRPGSLSELREEKMKKLVESGNFTGQEVETLREQLHLNAMTHEERFQTLWEGLQDYHLVWRCYGPDRETRWRSHLISHIQRYPEDRRRLEKKWGNIIARAMGEEPVEIWELHNAIWGLTVMGSGVYNDHLKKILHLTLDMLQGNLKSGEKLFGRYKLDRDSVESALRHCFHWWKPEDPHLRQSIGQLWWEVESRYKTWNNAGIIWEMIFQMDENETDLMECIQYRREQDIWNWGLGIWTPRNPATSEKWRAFCTACLMDHIHQIKKVPLEIRGNLWRNLFAVDPHHPDLAQLLGLHLPHEKCLLTLDAIVEGLKKNGLPAAMDESARQCLEEKMVSRIRREGGGVSENLEILTLLVVTRGKPPENHLEWKRRQETVKSVLLQFSHARDEAGKQLLTMPVDRWDYALLESLHTQIQLERLPMAVPGEKEKIVQWLSRMIASGRPLSDKNRVADAVCNMLRTETSPNLVIQALTLGNRLCGNPAGLQSLEWWQTLLAEERSRRETDPHFALVFQAGKMHFLICRLEEHFHEVFGGIELVTGKEPGNMKEQTGPKEVKETDRGCDGTGFLRLLRFLVHKFHESVSTEAPGWQEIWEAVVASQGNIDRNPQEKPAGTGNGTIWTMKLEWKEISTRQGQTGREEMKKLPFPGCFRKTADPATRSGQQMSS